VSATARIKARALELGFAAVGVARIEPPGADGAPASAGAPASGTTDTGQAQPPESPPTSTTPDIARFEAWLDAGRHAGMDWIASERSRARRSDATRLLEGARSMVCVAICHEPGRDAERDARLGRVARYAAGEDYHRVMRDLLRALEREILAALPGARTLWYSDTGALLERAWAARAGLGWIGKHAGLISPTLGSYLLLGEILVDRDLEPDPPLPREHCGTCTRCLEACPTGAIVAPHEVDARLCISYLTIEHRGPIEPGLRRPMGDWVFGCDVCQEVCPWNRFAPPAGEARLAGRPLQDWSLARLLELDEEGFRALFETSPIRRARRAGLLRNACVALGNRGDRSAVPALERARDHDPDPVVREHAAWALERIAEKTGR